MKVVIIGMDGATWNLLKPLADSGILPNIRNLISNGVWGTLESTLPPITAPAWVSFATGKRPEKHGIFDFLIPKGSLNNLVPVKPNDINSKTIFDYLSKFVSINMPLSTPPRCDGGIFLSDFLTRDESNLVYPPELKKKYPILEKYRIVPNERLRSNPTKYARDIRDLERIRFECAKQLFLNEDWSLFFILFSGTDWIQHICYRELVRGMAPKEVLGIYRDIDSYIGWFTTKIKDLDKEWVIFLVSDHGFKLYSKYLHLNTLLKLGGYLSLSNKAWREVHSHKMDVMRAKAFKTIRIPATLVSAANKIIPVYIKERILKVLNRFNIDVRIKGSIDFSNSLAVFIGSPSNIGLIYINDKHRFSDGIVEPNEKDKIVDLIITMLQNQRQIKNVRKILCNYPWCPDIMVEAEKEYIISGSLNRSIESDVQIADHDPYGIFLAYGSNIKKSTRIANIRIYDIAPTILHIFGLPIPDDMDGRVLMEIFEEDSEFAKRKPKYVDPSYYEKKREDEKLKKAIKNLKLKGKI